MNQHMPPELRHYIGRFAPSPTGPLHAGSLVAAMASYLDAKAMGGQWLVRMEDIDEPRTMPGAAEDILSTLATLGMQWDGDIAYQSKRTALYEAAASRLAAHTYACACTRREIADSRLGIASDGAAIYPGTCRNGLPAGRTPRAIRLRVPGLSDVAEQVTFSDRWQGIVTQHLASEVGDFVLKRADGFWAYQLAVVVDDAEQGVTHVVRGADLLDSTARQIFLQRLLKLPTPSYLHVPVITNSLGEKLSKQTGAQALDLDDPLATLMRAAQFLGLPINEMQSNAVQSIDHFWKLAIAAWTKKMAQ